jgi:putative salt-induced outer membrane protein YdiY
MEDSLPLLNIVWFVAAAHAEDPTFAGTSAPAPVIEAPESLITAELGGAWSSGNTDMYALNGKLDASHKWKMNKLSLAAGINIGKAVVDVNADGFLDDAERAIGQVETARRYFVDGRYDRFLTDKDSLYGLAGILIDPFAGYDNRTHGQLGYSRILVATEETGLKGEIGADVAREDFVAGIDPNAAVVVAAHALVALSYAFNENVSFTDTFEVFENVIDLEDVRIANSAGFSSKLNETFSLKLSHTLAFDNVPVEGFSRLDQTTLATFVATLL